MTKKTLILDLLRERPRTGWELCQLTKTARYGGRIHELREAGYDIEDKKIGPAQFLYTLVSEPEPIKISAPIPMENQLKLNYGHE